MNTYLRDIFISYSREDRAQVFPLVERINREVDTDCWIDLTGIESGSKFERKIMEAIDASKVVVFMLSDASLKSEWTEREVLYAEGEGKRIVPVLVNGERLRGWFKFHFGNVDYIDIRSAEQTAKLIVNLRTWLGRETATKGLAEEDARRRAEEAKRKSEEEAQRIKAEKERQKAEDAKLKPVKASRMRFGLLGSFCTEEVHGYINEMGKMVIPCQWKIARPFSEGLACVQDSSGKFGFIDRTGKVVIPCRWKMAYDFSDGMARVQDANGKWGYIDKTGKVVIPCQWYYALSFSAGIAEVKDANGKWLRIDKTGKVVKR